MIEPIREFPRTWRPPGSEPIAHLVAILASLAKGDTRLFHYPSSPGLQATLQCLQTLSVPIRVASETVEIRGQGLFAYQDTGDVLHAAGSLRTIRWMTGVMAGQPFTSCLTGNDSIRNQPMRRLIGPLMLMGAEIEARKGNYPPLIVRGNPLRPIRYTLGLPQEDLKTAILFGALFARGVTQVVESQPVTHYGEPVFRAFGASIERQRKVLCLEGRPYLRGLGNYQIPGDFNAALCATIAVMIHPEARMQIPGIVLSPRDQMVLDVLCQMGGRCEITDFSSDGILPVGTLTVESSPLHGIEIERAATKMIHEYLPLLAVAAAYARGDTVFHIGRDVWNREQRGLRALQRALLAMGIEIEVTSQAIRVCGPQQPRLPDTVRITDVRSWPAVLILGWLAQRPITCVFSDQALFPDPFIHGWRLDTSSATPT